MLEATIRAESEALAKGLALLYSSLDSVWFPSDDNQRQQHMPCLIDRERIQASRRRLIPKTENFIKVVNMLREENNNIQTQVVSKNIHLARFAAIWPSFSDLVLSSWVIHCMYISLDKAFPTRKAAWMLEEEKFFTKYGVLRYVHDWFEFVHW